MAEQSQETETQQVTVHVLAPQENASAPGLELGDEMEEQPVVTSSSPGVSLPAGTEQEEYDAHERVESEEKKLENVEQDLPLSSSSHGTHLQEEASPSVSKMIPSVNQGLGDLPEEMCTSHLHEAADVCISPHLAETDTGVDQKTVFAAHVNDLETVTEIKTDEGVTVTDVIKSDSGELSKFLEPVKSQSPLDIVPIEVGQFLGNPPENLPENPLEIEDTDDAVKDTDHRMEDLRFSPAVKEPEVDPIEEDLAPQHCVTAEPNTSSQELSEDELLPVCENQIAMEEGVQDCSLGNQDCSLGNQDSSLGNQDSSLGNQDSSLSKQDGSLGNQDSSLGNQDGSLGNQDGSLGNQDGSLGNQDGSLGNQDGSLGNQDGSLGNQDGSLGNQDGSLGNQDPVAPTDVIIPESITAALINDDTSSSQDFIKDDTVHAKSLATLDGATTDASGRSTPNVELLKDLTGRDSPSIRSLKGDSGRDSPSQRSRRRIGRDSVVTEANEANMGIFPAENLFEYQWPQEKGAEWYFVQEQVSEFLQVKSFKRKYPELERRVMDINEKDFLRERTVVTEEQVTLGLTALRADEVYDLMLKDAPDKSAEYARVLHEKEKQNISNKHKQYEAPSVDSNKVQEYVKKAVRQAAEYNSALMAERREERRYYFDMQTLTVQMPASRMKRQDKETTKLGPYPVAVIPGQYQNYYRSYSCDELKYFPLNTSLYGPMAPRRQTDLAPPQTNDEADQLSDNDTVLSTDNFDSSSDVSDHDQPIPMNMDNHDNVELANDDDRTPSITLPNDPSCIYKPKDIPNAICGLCLKNSSENKMGVPEKMIHCSQCDNSGHPSCLDMTLSMVEVIQTYPWQCMECKTCFHCGDPTHEDKMMFCDMCDRGYHTFCVGLQDIPTGLWACESCQMRDMPAALAPHVPTPPLPPTPPPAEPSLGEEPPSPQPAETTPSSKKKGRRPTTPVSATKQNTPGVKRSKSSTPTPKRVKKK